MTGGRTRPVETAADLPRFCPKCGSEMRVEDRVRDFDQQTGAPRYTVLARCSRFIWLGPDHDEFVVSPRPLAVPMPAMYS